MRRYNTPWQFCGGRWGTKTAMSNVKTKNFGPEAKAKYDKLRAKGVAPQEARERVQQSISDKRAAAKLSLGKQGAALRPSQKTENFRPNFAGKMDRANARVSRETGPQRAEVVQAEIIRKRVQAEVAQAISKQKAVERVFRDNPQSFSRVSSSKTPEEKAHKKKLKKERRQAARDLTGTDKSDWWSPIISAGADLLPKLLPMLIGMGDYSDPDDRPLKNGDSPESNSLLAASTDGDKGTSVPFMHRRNDKVRVTHREYLGDVYSSTANFSSTTFPLNPGMEETFPWCSPVANQFTNYRFMGMVADFVTQGSDYANVAGLGYVALATQYNPLAANFVDKREMMNYEFADAVKPSRSMTHWVECKPNDIPDPEKTCRAGVIPANADLRLYDHGKLTLAVGGNTASGSIIGMLWISYDVEFYLPKVSISEAGVLDFFMSVNTGADFSNPMGTAYTTNARSSIACTFTNSTLVFPLRLSGDFAILCEWLGTASNSAFPATVAGSGGVTVLQTSVSSGNTTSVAYWLDTWVRLDGIGATPTLTFSTTTSYIPTGTLRIHVVQIPRAPTESDIFDFQGKNYQSLYDSFMDKTILIQERALARVALRGPPVKTTEATSTRDDPEFESDDDDDEDHSDKQYLLREVGDWGLFESKNGFQIRKGFKVIKDLDLQKAFPKLFSETWSDLSDVEFCNVCDGMVIEKSPHAAGVGTILFKKKNSKLL